MLLSLARRLYENKILVAILIAAFFVRFIGIDYGLPQQFVADEFLMVAVSLKMLDTGSWRPNFPEIFYHQPLSAYISLFGIGGYLVWQMATGVFSGIGEIKNFYSVYSSNLLIMVRFLSVLFGTATVFLLYLIARDLFNRRVGYLAAFFGAFELLLVQFNHTGRIWGFMPFFIALALWANVKLFREGNAKNYVKSALASVAALMALMPGILTFIQAILIRFSFRNKKLWSAILLVVLGVAFAVYLNPRGLGVFLLRFDIDHTSLNQAVFNTAGEIGAIPARPFYERIYAPFLVLFNYMPVYFFLFFVGAFVLWKKDRKKLLFLISFPVVYYLFIGPFFSYGERVRTLTPLSVYFVVMSAFAADWIISSKFFSKRKFFSFCLIAAAGLYSIYFSILFNVRITRDDTRTQAINWVYNNLEENSSILVFSLSNEVISQNREVLEKMQELAPHNMNIRQKALLGMKDEDFPRPWYFAWDLRKTPPSQLPADFLKNSGFQYYLKTRWTGDESGRLTSDGRLEDSIESEFTEKKLIAVFKPFSGDKEFSGNFANNIINPAKVLLSVDRFGPIAEIYEVKF